MLLKRSIIRRGANGIIVAVLKFLPLRMLAKNAIPKRQSEGAPAGILHKTIVASCRKVPDLTSCGIGQPGKNGAGDPGRTDHEGGHDFQNSPGPMAGATAFELDSSKSRPEPAGRNFPGDPFFEAPGRGWEMPFLWPMAHAGTQVKKRMQMNKKNKTTDIFKAVIDVCSPRLDRSRRNFEEICLP